MTNDLIMFPLPSNVNRPMTRGSPSILVGARGDEPRHDLDVAILSSHVQRRLSIFPRSIHVGARGDESRHDLDVTATSRDAQGCPSMQGRPAFH